MTPFNIHSHKKTCDIKPTTNFDYLRNQFPTFSSKSVFYIVVCEEFNVDKTVFNLFEIALDKFFVSTFNKDWSQVFIPVFFLQKKPPEVFYDKRCS